MNVKVDLIQGRRKRKYLPLTKLQALKYAHLWKKQVNKFIVHTGIAFLDFCTQNTIFRITFIWF
jgi:hypothetical protein